jgi:hypothetical protein
MHTLDGRFLAFTGLDGDALRQVIVSSRNDDEVLQWVHRHARDTTLEEQIAWAADIDRYRPDASLLEYRYRTYPQLASQIDLSTVGVLDLLDLDEGRLPLSRFQCDKHAGLGYTT